MHKAETKMERITGGYSIHETEKPELCKKPFEPCGTARVIDCCGVEPDRDIVECSKCGKQKMVKCSFDDDTNSCKVI